MLTQEKPSQMSKALAIAELLAKEDSDVVSRVGDAIKALDKGIDDKLEAFDEVVQQVLDVVEAIEEKLDGREDSDNNERVMEAISRVSALVKAIPAPVPAKAPIINVSVQKEVDQLKVELGAMKAKQQEIMDMMGMLLTARRVPVRDSKGNVIAVELETNS
jgi:Mg2+ and Co2+ transporter CorA